MPDLSAAPGEFSFALTASVLARLPNRNRVERFDAARNRHSRALVGSDGRSFIVRAGDAGSGVTLSSSDSVALEWARASFALALDPSPFYAVAARDPVLGECVARLRGLRPPLMNFWEAWVAAILGQQITLSFCLDTIGYVSKRFGGEVMDPESGEAIYLHPTPESILEADPYELYLCKVSRQKCAYLKTAASALLEGYFDGVLEMPLAEALAKLTALKGVGRWTARYWLATVGRLDSLAYGDAGLANAYKSAYGRTHDLEAWGEALGDVRGWAYYYLIWGVKYLPK
jgi:3-methyladenine DNA glycosylase/8-oxoguanine DNA glycosylase